MAEVNFEKVQKVYPGGIRAVGELSLRVADGELVVIVGPSGCGKSTTLRMVAGLEQVTSGTISIGRRVVNKLPPKDRDVAMVFQNYALYPQMTVYQNMAFGLKLRKVAAKQIDARIRQAATILELDGLLDRRPAALSGGERQRVALGRAIVRKPTAFLFDEPLSNVDAQLRAQMRVQIDRLHTQLGTTMLYVTHDQSEAMTMGDRVVVLNRGVVQQVADPITLYNSPANRFVAGFIGTPSMNFLTGRIRRQDDRLVFQAAGEFTLPIPEAKRQSLATYQDREITIGIRPEHIGSPTAEQSAGAPRLRATVELVEPLGAETYVYLKTDAAEIVSRVDSQHQFHVGQQTAPAVLSQHAHFFDPITEETIA